MGADPEGVTADGPSGIRLRSSTVQTLAMGIHELATNASKYGALMQPLGRLDIRWSFEPVGADGKPWLRIDWREMGLTMPPIDAPPRGTGQGRELIEKALPYQLGGVTSYAFEPDGVHCTISVPVSTKKADREDV
ncbi:two-component sensor histidine kinase [Rhizobium sp. BK512]|uniref:sensor histidine kinase n=1 Tax=Rhizobium sp. BK512 TaxID=2587010 RepID=UPI000DE039EF|nr:sensor histidine kinase [Rhizobium sp. BK512]MBB3564968.1 two-component sensor histidine kinase [Rhizobium sp. BK512]